MSEEPQPKVRKVVLPSGRTIEVVYFADGDAAESRDVVEDLHNCGSCNSKLVYPTEWAEAGAHHWRVTLRCPNCEWTGSGVFEQEAVERFDAELDRGTEALVDDLKRLMHASMEEEIGRFVAALAADAIRPEDF